MILIHIIAEIVVIVVCSVGSGMWALRRLRVNALPRLCLAIGLSWLFIYVGSTAIYLLQLPSQWNFAVTGISLLLAILSIPEFQQIWQNRRARESIYCFAALFVWHLLILTFICSYAGANLGGDWIEHYQRSLFFLDHLPTDTKFVGDYVLPARPPMMNIIACSILAQTGKNFELYQIAMLFLNLLVYFPCVLISTMLGGRRVRPAILAVFFAASPVIAQNATFTWTKLFTAFYIVLGLWLYVRGWIKQDSKFVVAAFMSLACGFIAHYSAGPYLVCLVLHYLFIFRSRRSKFRELSLSASLGGLILASWFAWALPRYGVSGGLASNTTVSDTGKLSLAENARKIASNLLSTIVPHPLHVPWHEFGLLCYQPNALGMLRDYWFLICQDTVIVAMGSVGGLVVIYLILKKLNSSAVPLRLRIFWCFFILFCLVVGIAVHGTAELWGVAHVCLQPLIVLGITLLATNFLSLKTWLRQMVVVGLVLDFCLGLFLQMHLQRIFPTPLVTSDGVLFPLNDQSLSLVALGNFQLHYQLQVTFLGEHLAGFQTELQIAFIMLFAGLIWWLSTVGKCGSSELKAALIILLLVGVALCGRDQFQDNRADDASFVSASAEDAQLRQCEAAVKENPQLSLIWRSLGESLYRSGRALDAIPCFFNGYFLDVDSLQARFEAGFCWRVTGKMLTSDSIPFKVAEDISHDPTSAAARTQMAQILAQRHDLEAGEKQAGIAVQLSPTAEYSQYLLGLILLAEHNPSNLESAINHLTMAVRQKPQATEAISALRYALGQRGDDPRKIEQYIISLGAPTETGRQ